MGIDSDLFRLILGRFATGITVVTARDSEQRPHGMTVSAFASLSLDPPLVLVCIDNAATMAPLMAATGHFGVNVLASGQEEISRRFAGPLDDRFAGIGYREGENGCAILEGVLAWMECRITARHPAGDHVIIVGEVERGDARDGNPLLYFRGGYASLGH
jgi:flavin reductase (DIM6/NTAB) family NADH-FMN oxidoreductase RutF